MLGLGRFVLVAMSCKYIFHLKLEVGVIVSESIQDERSVFELSI